MNVALIVPSPAADVGWSHTLLAGVKALEADYGAGVKITLLENIPEGPDADRIMNKTVADGNTLVILGSFGYMNGGLKLAKAHPEVSILHASGYEVATNFSPFGARYYQGTYLMGMAAASLSKTKKLGCVGAFAIPELITSINAFTLGAQSIDPAIEVSVVWVNSWFDPASEQEAAKALLSQGVDVIFSNAQDTPSVISVAEEAGAYVFNLNSSMKAYAPKKYLAWSAPIGPPISKPAPPPIWPEPSPEPPHGWAWPITWSTSPIGTPTFRRKSWPKSPPCKPRSSTAASLPSPDR